MLVLGRRPIFRGYKPASRAEAAAMMRRPGHAIRIGPDIFVRIIEIDNGLVRVGIEAPADVIVVRDELPLAGWRGGLR